MNETDRFLAWFNVYSKEIKRLTNITMNAEDCLATWLAAKNDCHEQIKIMTISHRSTGKSTHHAFIGVVSALQHIVEVYDSEDGKQWTTSSKKEAIAKARAAIDKAMG